MSVAPSFGGETPAGRSMLGKSVVVKGEIHSHEALTIEGEVDGSIEMLEHRLTIAGNGKVRATVKAREIDVIGSMNGQAEALDKIHIRKGAEFVGDIQSASIVIEDGGYMKGNIDLSRTSNGPRH
jgi:cytoskeletal protein CcmA (bactofilin family)